MTKSIRIIPHMCVVFHPLSIGFGWGVTEYFSLEASTFCTTFDPENPNKNTQIAIEEYLSSELNITGDIHTNNGYIIAHSPRMRGDDILTYSYRVTVDDEPLEWGDFPDIFPDFVHDWNE